MVGVMAATADDAASVRWPGRVAAVILGVWSLLTMARGLMWFDTGELALVAYELGLGHPPGQPLYTLLAGLCARIPGVDALVGMNALSAICAGLCALPADALAQRMAPSLGAGARCLLLLAVGVLVPLWDQASRIELYAPATLMSLVLLAGGARAADEARDGAGTWLGLGVLAGLGACINPVFALAAALGAGLCALPMLLRSGVGTTLRAIGAAAGGAVIGLLPYLYVVWVATRTDRLVWGEWGSLDGIVDYLALRDYAHTEHAAWAQLPANMLTWGGWLLLHGALPAVALGALGWLTTGRSWRRAPIWLVPLVTGAIFAFNLARFDPDVPDFQSYLAPALWLLPAGLGGLFARLRPTAGFLAAAALVMAGAMLGERPLHARNRSGVDLPQTLAEAWLADVPPGGILVVASDHLVFPLLYAQRVERRRQDVVLINLGWAASGWYWRLLYRTHPELARIELAAPDTPQRVRRLLLAERDRPVRVESVAIAAAVGIRPCPATWGFALGSACGATRDDEGRFLAGLAAGWQGPSGRDPISRRVLAWLGQTRAEGLWALGDAEGALRALRAGAPPDVASELPIPARLGRPAAVPLRLEAVLIGDWRLNLLLGAEALQALGHGEAAEVWRAAAAS